MIRVMWDGEKGERVLDILKDGASFRLDLMEAVFLRHKINDEVPLPARCANHDEEMDVSREIGERYGFYTGYRAGFTSLVVYAIVVVFIYLIMSRGFNASIQ